MTNQFFVSSKVPIHDTYTSKINSVVEEFLVSAARCKLMQDARQYVSIVIYKKGERERERERGGMEKRKNWLISLLQRRRRLLCRARPFIDPRARYTPRQFAWQNFACSAACMHSLFCSIARATVKRRHADDRSISAGRWDGMRSYRARAAGR